MGTWSGWFRRKNFNYPGEAGRLGGGERWLKHSGGRIQTEALDKQLEAYKNNQDSILESMRETVNNTDQLISD